MLEKLEKSELKEDSLQGWYRTLNYEGARLKLVFVGNVMGEFDVTIYTSTKDHEGNQYWAFTNEFDQYEISAILVQLLMKRKDDLLPLPEDQLPNIL